MMAPMNSRVSRYLLHQELKRIVLWTVLRVLRTMLRALQGLCTVKEHMTLLNLFGFLQAHVNGNIAWVDMSVPGSVALRHVVVNTKGIVQTYLVQRLNLEILDDSISNLSC